MQKIALLLAYNGGYFCGWQKQLGSGATDQPSVQATVEEAVRTITQESIKSVVGSGRTDAGVHAAGQVCHFVLREKRWDPERLRRGLNWKLGTSKIQVLKCIEAPEDFHAQRDAIKKQYSYYFQQGPCPIPTLEPQSWWIERTLDHVAMHEGVQALQGEHDFFPFQASGANKGSTVRTISEIEVTRFTVPFPMSPQYVQVPVEFVRLRVVGTGFLRQMVRGIAGTALQVGEKRRNPSCFTDILESRDRKLVGPTAPGRALWLDQVWYEKIDFQTGV